VASNIKNIAKGRTWSGDMDLNADSMRLILCMTNTTADTDIDADNTSSYTLDEMDGANYARQTLANIAVNVDDANDRAEFDADDVSIASLGNGTRAMQGYLIHEHITNDAASFPFLWNDFSSTINPGGSTFTITWNAEGIAQQS
jgi:hypothetical protein